MFLSNKILRIISLILVFSWWVYWTIKGKEAHRKKQKTQKTGLKNIIERLPVSIGSQLIFIQLLGLKILTFPKSLLIESFGFIILIIGIFLSISGRKQLDNNWSAAYEYQIKHNQTLIKEGIYKYIRHPIYAGMILMFFGAELVAQSYLYFLTPVIFLWLYNWAKREEVLLIKHFGNKYRLHMKKSKMFIPFIV